MTVSCYMLSGTTNFSPVLLDSWHACEDADVLIESPSAMAGVHIAEALKIPYFVSYTSVI